jgi:hypothetical protein
MYFKISLFINTGSKKRRLNRYENKKQKTYLDNHFSLQHCGDGGGADRLRRLYEDGQRIFENAQLCFVDCIQHIGYYGLDFENFQKNRLGFVVRYFFSTVGFEALQGFSAN